MERLESVEIDLYWYEAYATLGTVSEERSERVELTVNLNEKNGLGFYSDVMFRQKLDVGYMGLLNSKLSDPKVILDVGCNDGTHTAFYIKSFPSAKVYAFEPDPRAILQFRKNLEGYENWELFEGAVSDKVGEIHLNIAFRQGQNWSLSSSIVESIPGQYHLTFPFKTPVKTTSLDQWIKNKGIEMIDFAHTDLQGAERLMVEGAGEALKITRYIMMEYGEKDNHPSAMSRDETVELMAGHGFTVELERKGNLLFENTKLL